MEQNLNNYIQYNGYVLYGILKSLNNICTYKTVRITDRIENEINQSIPYSDVIIIIFNESIDQNDRIREIDKLLSTTEEIYTYDIINIEPQLSFKLIKIKSNNQCIHIFLLYQDLLSTYIIYEIFLKYSFDKIVQKNHVHNSTVPGVLTETIYNRANKQLIVAGTIDRRNDLNFITPISTKLNYVNILNMNCLIIISNEKTLLREGEIIHAISVN